MKKNAIVWAAGVITGGLVVGGVTTAAVGHSSPAAACADGSGSACTTQMSPAKANGAYDGNGAANALNNSLGATRSSLYSAGQNTLPNYSNVQSLPQSVPAGLGTTANTVGGVAPGGVSGLAGNVGRQAYTATGGTTANVGDLVTGVTGTVGATVIGLGNAVGGILGGKPAGGGLLGGGLLGLGG